MVSCLSVSALFLKIKNPSDVYIINNTGIYIVIQRVCKYEYILYKIINNRYWGSLLPVISSGSLKTSSVLKHLELQMPIPFLNVNTSHACVIMTTLESHDT